MIIRGEPAVTKIKSQLVSLYTEEPFWDISPRTDFSCVYKGESFKYIPNGITEAHARGLFLLSFQNTHFQSEVVCFNKDSSTCEVTNFCLFRTFHDYLRKIGVIEYWYKNSFEIVQGYFFEIRFDESNHKKAHFHVAKGNYSGSYSIPELCKLAGNVPNVDEKEILRWAQINISHIVEMWNRLHLSMQIKLIV